jgi:maltose/moltooligosaccharide transporter
MPNSPVLWIAAGMLWIMDASINVRNPFVRLLEIVFQKNNEQWDLQCKAFYGYWRIKITINFTHLGVKILQLGVIPDSVKYLLFWRIAFLVTVL